MLDMAGRAALSFLLSFVAGTINVVDIGKGNEIIIAQTEVMLVNFYADWCRFSRQLHPIFVNTANVLREGNILILRQKTFVRNFCSNYGSNSNFVRSIL